MADVSTTIRLELIPVPPDTVDSAKAEVVPLIEEALREAGREDLLERGEITVEVGQTFPDAIVIPIVISVVSSIAAETYKKVVLPYLMKKFGKGKEEEHPAGSGGS